MGRAPCCSNVGLHRGQWTAREDALLTKYILNHGEGNWRSLPRKADLLRCGKSCRLRWMNYLRPDIKRGNISPEEEDLIIRLHILLGNRWSLIAGRLPGRTDNEIKNYWNSHLSKKLRKQGFIIKEGVPRSRRSGAPHSHKENRSKKCHGKNKSTEIMQCGEEAESFKIYAPKPTRFKPRWPATGKNESAETTEGANGASGDSGCVIDVDFISSSLDSRHREFDRIIGFSDHVYVEHVGMGHAFPIQVDASLERLFREYTQLL